MIQSPSSIQSPNPVFARHETFHPRFGWLKKGFDQSEKDDRIFLAEDAPVRLGVGKNMVRSLRYWCQAFKILEGDRSLDPNQTYTVVIPQFLVQGREKT
ncbi:DUF4007 family protein [Limnospira platensis]|uniref:DUF4007 family protein n=1 Tax=Limnospira platensis TaxID=118562 RepID=UPI0002804573|nr:hypothetical protein SPLC1_S208640 [Arthrospira platensis C1]UWU46422.1 Protein of unknown function (DUF4007) [Arthrospira platensis C1]